MIMRILILYDYNIQVLSGKIWNQYNEKTCNFMYISLYYSIYVLICIYLLIIPIHTMIGHTNPIL